MSPASPVKDKGRFAIAQNTTAHQLACLLFHLSLFPVSSRCLLELCNMHVCGSGDPCSGQEWGTAVRHGCRGRRRTVYTIALTASFSMSFAALQELRNRRQQHAHLCQFQVLCLYESSVLLRRVMLLHRCSCGGHPCSGARQACFCEEAGSRPSGGGRPASDAAELGQVCGQAAVCWRRWCQSCTAGVHTGRRAGSARYTATQIAQGYGHRLLSAQLLP